MSYPLSRKFLKEAITGESLGFLDDAVLLEFREVGLGHRSLHFAGQVPRLQSVRHLVSSSFSSVCVPRFMLSYMGLSGRLSIHICAMQQCSKRMSLKDYLRYQSETILRMHRVGRCFVNRDPRALAREPGPA